MKKLFRLITVLTLALTMSLTAFACTPNDEGDTYGEFTPIKFEGIHSIVYTESATDYLVKNGVSDYTIVLPDKVSDTMTVAKDEMQLLFKRATGYFLPAIYESDIENLTEAVATGKYLSFGANKLFEAAQLGITEAETKSLAYDGLILRTKNKNVFFYGAYDGGVVNAVYSFLEYHFGFRYYHRNSWYIEQGVTDEKLINFNVIDVPDIERRTNNVAWYSITHDPMKTVDPLVEGITPQDVKNRSWRNRTAGAGHQNDLLPIIHDRKNMKYGDGYIHNAMEYIPNTIDADGKPVDYDKYYFEEYYPDAARVPQWWTDAYGDLEYNSVNMAAKGLTRQYVKNGPNSQDNCAASDWRSTGGEQMCYTARGNAISFDALAKRCAEMIEYSLIEFTPEKWPYRDTVTITMEDVGAVCSCEACLHDRQNENFTSSGSVIKLLNAVNVYVREWMNKPENAAYKREEFHIVSFAYSTLATAPAVYSETEGKYVPCNDEVVGDEGVGVYYADNLYANYYTPLYAPENEDCIGNWEAWDACVDYFWFWGYPTIPQATIYPHDSRAFFNNDFFQYIASKDVRYVFLESQDSGDNATSFQNFSCWMEARLMWDSTLDIDALIKEYFDNMYYEASETMQYLMRSYSLHIQTLADQNNLRNNNWASGATMIKTTSFWPLPMLESWLGLCDKALSEIDHYRLTNPNLYLVIKDRIDLESMTPLYVILEHYGKTTGTNRLSMNKYQEYKLRLYDISIQYPQMSSACSGPLILDFVLAK